MKNRSNKSKIRVILTAATVVIIVSGFAGIALRELFVQRRLSERYPLSKADIPDIPGELMAFEEIPDPVRIGHESVYDFSVDREGRIYVAGDRSVHIFDSDGSISGKISLPATPSAVKAANDTVYVALSDHLAVFSMDGELIDRWEPASDNSLITSIEVHGDKVFLADAASRFVRRYDKEGNPLGQIGARDTESGVPGIVLPSPCFVVVMGSDGLLRLNNPGRHRIEIYTTDGELKQHWGKHSSAIEGFCGCCNPVHFDLLPDGRYVTAEKGLIRIKIYDADGNFESVVAGPDQLAPGSLQLLGQRSPDRDSANFKVAAGSDGLIHVLDPRGKKVRFFRETENE